MYNITITVVPWTNFCIAASMSIIIIPHTCMQPFTVYGRQQQQQQIRVSQVRFSQDGKLMHTMLQCESTHFSVRCFPQVHDCGNNIKGSYKNAISVVYTC